MPFWFTSMAPIAGKPFLHYIIADLQSKGFDRIVLSLGYKHEMIEKWLSTLNTSAKISYIVENTPLGTGGAVKLALARTAAEKGIGGGSTDAEENEIFILNGDTFFSIDFRAMLAQHRKTGAEVTIALKEMADFDRFGAVDYDIRTNCIRSFSEKKYRLLGMVNGGIYLMNHNALANYPESFSLEQDYFEKIAPGGRIFGYSKDCNKYFIDIGVPEDYAKAEADFSDPDTSPWNRGLFPDPDKMLEWTNEEHIKTTLNLHPASGFAPWEDKYAEMAKAMDFDTTGRHFVPWQGSSKKFMRSVRPLHFVIF